MIRIVASGKLAALRAAAGLVPGLRSAAAQASVRQQEAEAARLAAAADCDKAIGERAQAQAAQARAEAERDAALGDITAGLARLEAAASDPAVGESVKAGIALHVLRHEIARIRASGDAAAIDSIRLIEALIGQDDGPGEPAALPAPAAARETQTNENPGQEEQPVTPDPIAPYRHRNFISVEQGPDGLCYKFQPFSGWEQEPQVPAAAWKDQALTWADTQRLSDEYEAASALWHRPRFLSRVTPVLKEAVPAWQAYAQARSSMDAEYAAFWETEDGRWRAQLLRLVTAHDLTLAAAEAWDRRAAYLASLYREYHDAVISRYALPLRDFAAAAGIDAAGWEIDFYHDRYPENRHGYGTPQVKAVRAAITEQQDRLRTVGELAPASALDAGMQGASRCD